MTAAPGMLSTGVVAAVCGYHAHSQPAGRVASFHCTGRLSAR
jgi:hypothetical protein